VRNGLHEGATLAPVPQPDRGPLTSGLTASDLTVRFGGLVAVDNVSLHAPEGHITGLIGPNGAGKTTIFNACTGLVKPSSGRVSLSGTDVGSAPPQARARLGLGRTFQRMELFESLTVWDNVAMGREGVKAGNLPWHHLWSSRTAAAEVKQATGDALEVCGIAELARRRPSDLSTGERRLVELARVVAGSFQILLLDEPSSGLDQQESQRFGVILTELVAERGMAILLVEHDVELVMSICDYIYVLDFGCLIYEGVPRDVADSPIVRAAYLGTSDEAAAAGIAG
jgi:ABC-type branched-subunit amino acid transport system ATPase component